VSRSGLGSLDLVVSDCMLQPFTFVQVEAVQGDQLFVWLDSQAPTMLPVLGEAQDWTLKCPWNPWARRNCSRCYLKHLESLIIFYYGRFSQTSPVCIRNFVSEDQEPALPATFEASRTSVDATSGNQQVSWTLVRGYQEKGKYSRYCFHP
jgi:hypothetical protein